jgi:uncharacterized membrane protein
MAEVAELHASVAMVAPTIHFLDWKRARRARKDRGKAGCL